MEFTLDQILNSEKEFRRNLINSVNGFKSPHLVGTIDQKGRTNLALYSQLLHIGANPPLVGLLSRPMVVPRHTLENIIATRLFTVNHVHEGIYKQAHTTSARWEESEFAATGLTEEYREGIKTPFVKESLIKSLYSFKERHVIQINQTTLVVGQLEMLMIDEGLVSEDGFVDLEKAGTLAVAGLDSYHNTQLIERLPYAKPTDRQP